jgi:hypothetical protein
MAAKKKRSWMVTPLLITFSLGMIAIFKTGFIFFIIAILPSIVAFYFDRSRGRLAYQSVLACNLSGILPFMAQILKEPNSGSYVVELMSTASNWLIIYASAGFGWVLVYASPLFAQAIITMFYRGQIARFEAQQQRIERDWGPEVAHFFNANKQEEEER